jgi:plastocyanin
LSGILQTGTLGSASSNNQLEGAATSATPAGTVNAAPYVPKDGVITQVVEPIEKQADEIIDITTVGFSPQEVDIKAGQSVLWTNRDKAKHWVVVASSTPYPDKGACGSAFNSCIGLKLGENFRLTFKTPGRWNYYDKLNPKFTGVVVVD